MKSSLEQQSEVTTGFDCYCGTSTDANIFDVAVWTVSALVGKTRVSSMF